MERKEEERLKRIERSITQIDCVCGASSQCTQPEYMIVSLIEKKKREERKGFIIRYSMVLWHSQLTMRYSDYYQWTKKG